MPFIQKKSVIYPIIRYTDHIMVKYIVKIQKEDG